MKWPWEKVDNKPRPSQRAIDLEREEIWREINQVKLINKHTLARAVARNYIPLETAEAIRAIQVDPEEYGVDGGNTGKT